MSLSANHFVRLQIGFIDIIVNQNQSSNVFLTTFCLTLPKISAFPNQAQMFNSAETLSQIRKIKVAKIKCQTTRTSVFVQKE